MPDIGALGPQIFFDILPVTKELLTGILPVNKKLLTRRLLVDDFFAIPKPSFKLIANLGKALLSVNPLPPARPLPIKYLYNQGLSSQTRGFNPARDFAFGIQERCQALG